MARTVLHGKLHLATITQADPEYEGSITIDAALLVAADMVEFERVLVANVANGARFETYTIAAPAGSGVIGLNGAAAHLGAVGQRVIIMAFETLVGPALAAARPHIVLLDGANRVREVRRPIPATAPLAQAPEAHSAGSGPAPGGIPSTPMP